MNIETHLRRPSGWQESKERQWPRVAFIAHGLGLEEGGYLSTGLIQEKLRSLGLHPLGSEFRSRDTPGFFRWLEFPVVTATGEKCWVDFYIIPLYASQFIRGLAPRSNPKAYKWVEAVAFHAIEEARRDGVSITVGFGAMTKNATDFGRLFHDRHPEFRDIIATTHGDAGTAALVLEQLRSLGMPEGLNIAVIGANGVIGDMLARALVDQRFGINPQKLVLVGQADQPGSTKKRDRLDELRQRVLRVGGNSDVSVGHSPRDDTEDVSPCVEHDADIVIVATNGGHRLLPKHVVPSTIIFDLCAPAACHAADWRDSDSLVLTSGSGNISSITPEGFGMWSGSTLRACNSAGDGNAWGCFCETVAWALEGREGHLFDRKPSVEEVHWIQGFFSRFGIRPQELVSFGQPVPQEMIDRFVAAKQVVTTSYN